MNLSIKNTVLLKKGLIALVIVFFISLLLSYVFSTGDIVMILRNYGVRIPKWVSTALTSIGSVYGVRNFLIGALGVSVPLWVAAAVAATSSAGL